MSITSIKIKHLEIDKYILNFEILPDERWGIFSRNKETVRIFINQLNGIKENQNTCFMNDIDLFDDKDYFKDRVYLNFKDSYINSIKAKNVKSDIYKRYKKCLDIKKFEETIETLQTRCECEIKNRYIFTQKGNTFLNCAFAYALEKQMLIVSNPTINVKEINEKKEIARRITDINAEGIAFICLDSLACFEGTLDKVIILDDFNNVRIIDPKKDTFVLVDDYPSNEDILKEKVFDCVDKTIIYNLNNDNIKECKRLGKCEVLSFYQIEDYL
ncbi:MAG: hypothetical protein PHT83_06170 [Bacilli bacterium]|nr:hypothetical protein [Bacilli bacterium]